MIYVPDTNNLLRFANRADKQHATVLSAIRKLKNGGDKIYILPQTGVEFWFVPKGGEIPKRQLSQLP